MRKIIFTACIALGLLGCSHENADDNINTDQKTTVIAKIAVGEEAFPSLNNKNVNRGSIPTTINKITVDVVNNNPAVPHSQTVFDLVANGSPGAENSFYIDDVTSGINTFTATASTTAEAMATTTTYIRVDDATTNSMINSQKEKIPYAKYKAIQSKNIHLGVAQEIQFPLTTLNGRIIALVETGTTLSAMNRKVEVIGARKTEGGAIVNTGTVDITGTKSSLTYWSDDNSVKGAYLDYTVNIYSEDGLEIENTFTKKITVKESTGITSKMTITIDGITEDIHYGTFTLPPWTEISE